MKVSRRINGELVVREIRDKDFSVCRERGWKRYSEDFDNDKEMLEKNEGDAFNRKKRRRKDK